VTADSKHLVDKSRKAFTLSFELEYSALGWPHASSSKTSSARIFLSCMVRKVAESIALRRQDWIASLLITRAIQSNATEVQAMRCSMWLAICHTDC
jgi:hypothetical protein